MRKENPFLSLVPFLCLYLIVISLFIIPFRILQQGYLPGDDALRHAAKVISGKSWDQILVISDKIRMDAHTGWHDVLGWVRAVTGCDQYGLVAFSVAFLFLFFCSIPLFFLELPEAWLFSLFIISLTNDAFIYRIFSGRPYLVTMAVLLSLCFSWPRFKEERLPYKTFFLLAFLVALSIWIHGSWYLLLLPIACFFLAREYKAAFRISMAVAIGVIAGAMLTRQPFLLLRQEIIQGRMIFGSGVPQMLLADEFRPFAGDILTVLIVCGMLLWSYSRGKWNISKVYNPVFLLALLGWCMGFLSGRFWNDWGMPALCVWMSLEFQSVLKEKFNRVSPARIIIILILAALVYSKLTSDAHYQWSDSSPGHFLDYNNPGQKKLLPDPGGIIYSNDMTVFYETFYRNPQAPWRYVLGFEPAWMKPDDLEIFREIQKSSSSSPSYIPWVKKMKPQDRLILKRPKYASPGLSELVWDYVSPMIWIGRLPEK
jgi:hypothetical protein